MAMFPITGDYTKERQDFLEAQNKELRRRDNELVSRIKQLEDSASVSNVQKEMIGVYTLKARLNSEKAELNEQAAKLRAREIQFSVLTSRRREHEVATRREIAEYKRDLSNNLELHMKELKKKAREHNKANNVAIRNLFIQVEQLKVTFETVPVLKEKIAALRRTIQRYESTVKIFTGSEKRRIADSICSTLRVYYGSDTLRNRVMSLLDSFLLEEIVEDDIA